MKVDVIIPNYNGSDLIKKNISSVTKALEGYSGKLIIVDDGSSPEDKNALREIIEDFKKNTNCDIEYIEHKKNCGFSSAVNTGVKKSDAEYVVLLNSDVSPSSDFLKSPLDMLEHNDNLFAVGCMDKSIEKGKTILRGRGIACWQRGLLQHSRGEIDKTDTFWVSGGSSIFRKELYQKLGGMDEIYNPFYWEDIDLSYRARKAGYKIFFDKTSVVMHFHEEGAIKKYFEDSKVTHTAYRNQFIFIWKNITDLQLLLSHCLNLPLHLVGAFKRRDLNFFTGFFLALIRLPAIISRRKKQKKYYKFSDSEIINNIA